MCRDFFSPLSDFICGKDIIVMYNQPAGLAGFCMCSCSASGRKEMVACLLGWVGWWDGSERAT